ncbi:hypothetical protein LTR04_007125, partial [Oleoguttula sp. CCFEE 6159]
FNVRTLLNPDDSPPRSSVPNTPQSARFPPQYINQSSALPSINQGFETQNRASVDYAAHLDSRRSSVDSRMNANFGHLGLNNPTSPYESQNASQVSLAASLQHQRGITNQLQSRPNGNTSMSSLSGRSGVRGQHPAPRIAPPIINPRRSSGAPDPTAANPTKGFAWAFPDGPIPEEQRRTSSSDDSSLNHSVSRNGSFAASSIRSSIFSVESQLPQGQRRFTNEPATTHHHSMQHRTVAGLQSDAGSVTGSGNYSRTPELRVSHKLAERKRRSEMKDLFDELHKSIPGSIGSKSSKWETLSKAIDHIKGQDKRLSDLFTENSKLRGESDWGREAAKEIDQLRNECTLMFQQLRRLEPNNRHVYGYMSSQLMQQDEHGVMSNGPGGPILPPLHNGAPSQTMPQSAGQAHYASAPPGAMQGVEHYGRPKGYEPNGYDAMRYDQGDPNESNRYDPNGHGRYQGR